MKRIVINGWYGCGNAGDEAILQQFLAEMADSDDVHVTILSEFPKQVIRDYGSDRITSIYHAHTVGLRGLRCWLDGSARSVVRAIRRCDLFVLGGGGILRDNTTLRNLCRVIDEIWWARLFRKKIAMYAIGVGPLVTGLGKSLIRRTAARCDVVTVRDRESAALLESLGLPADRITTTADPAILLAPRPAEDAALRSHVESAADRKQVGLYVAMGFVGNGQFLAPLARALDRLHAEHGFTFLAPPLRYLEDVDDDRAVLRRVAAEMEHPEAVERLDRELPAREIKWICGQMPLNLTIRLHAMIFALSSATPAVAVNYEPKVANIMEQFGQADLIVEMDGSLEERLVERVVSCWARRELVAEGLEDVLPRAREAAMRTFTVLRELRDRTG